MQTRQFYLGKESQLNSKVASETKDQNIGKKRSRGCDEPKRPGEEF